MPAKAILIVDDHSLFRESLRLLLQDREKWQAIETCEHSREALAEADLQRFELVLLDDGLDPERGLRLLHAVRERPHPPKVLMVTASVTLLSARRFLMNGCAGIIHKHSPVAHLVEAIDCILCGGVWLDCKTRSMLAGLNAHEPLSTTTLNPRETAVLQGVFAGFKNREIAENLHTSETCVKALVQNLFSKLGVRTRSQLVQAAVWRMPVPNSISPQSLYTY